MNKDELIESLKGKIENIPEKELIETINNLNLKYSIKSKRNQFREGELVAYLPKDFDKNIYKVEIGKIKKLCNDGAFIWYHIGDTAAKTDYRDLYKIDNEYAIFNLGGLNEQEKNSI